MVKVIYDCVHEAGLEEWRVAHGWGTTGSPTPLLASVLNACITVQKKSDYQNGVVHCEARLTKKKDKVLFRILMRDGPLGANRILPFVNDFQVLGVGAE